MIRFVECLCKIYPFYRIFLKGNGKIVAIEELCAHDNNYFIGYDGG